MPLYTIETTYRLPYYRQRTYNAATVEDACRLAVDDDDWDNEKPDFECAGETYVTGIWAGADMAYEGKNFPVPSHFDESIQRKADHVDELIELLDTVAKPMGISKVDFEHWLPRAQAAVAKAKAIVEGRRDPGEISVEFPETET